MGSICLSRIDREIQSFWDHREALITGHFRTEVKPQPSPLKAMQLLHYSFNSVQWTAELPWFLAQEVASRAPRV